MNMDMDSFRQLYSKFSETGVDTIGDHADFEDRVVRGQDDDLEVIRQMAERDALVEDALRANLLAVIEMLYGEAEADRLHAEWAARE
jgi:hypothetical protein